MLQLLKVESKEAIIVSCTHNDVFITRSMLGEVCYGIHIDNFDEHMRGSKEHYVKLFKHTDRIYDSKVPAVDLTLSPHDLKMIKFSFIEVMRDFSWLEYHPRTARNFEEILSVFASLIVVMRDAEIANRNLQ